MKACDVGTMWLVKGEIDEIDDSGVSFQMERNVFAEVQKSLEDPDEVLKENNYTYIKYKNRYYVVGEDVFKVHDIESLFKGSGQSSYFSEVRRPMRDGLINTAEDKMSIAIIQAIIKKLVGKPSVENEVLCFCVPGDPVTSNANVLFHRMMLTNFIKSLGYTPECINEALALIFSECPTSEDPDEEGGVAKFSGLGISMGAGMCNLTLSWKQIPLLSFSVEHCGDWIDHEAAKIAGCDVATITKYKEKHFSFGEDSAELKHMALNVYYEAMMNNVIENFSSRFKKMEDEEKRDIPLEIVIGGGTASVPGFAEKFASLLKATDLPFKVKDVRMAKNPLFSVCNGCLIKAISVESKLNKKPKKEPSSETTPKEDKQTTSNKENLPKKIKLNKE